MAKKSISKRTKDILGPVQTAIAPAKAKAKAKAPAKAPAKVAEVKEAVVEVPRAAQRSIGAGRRLGGKLVG